MKKILTLGVRDPLTRVVAWLVGWGVVSASFAVAGVAVAVAVALAFVGAVVVRAVA